MAMNIMIQGTMSNAGKSLLPRGTVQEPEYGAKLLHHQGRR